MIRGRLHRVVTILLISVIFLWGSALSFADPFSCIWPSGEEYMLGLTIASVGLDLEDRAVAHMEKAVMRYIVNRGSYPSIRFNPERDFIEHALPGQSHVWQYIDDHLVSVEESVALEAMQEPVSMSDYHAGRYPRIFRFAIMHPERRHACVLIETDEPIGGMHYLGFYHMYRSILGFGPWWVMQSFPQDGVLYGW
jgi:hypothetical protein